ncbi:hypothetical protein EJ06DRAFT_458223, partial [Trichodelitschia bisporula]
RIHVEHRRFQCPQCSRGFHWEKDLTRHMSTHTGDRNFVCYICARKYSRFDNLRRHYHTNHPDILAP